MQYGGQTPLRLAVPLAKEGAPILGTPPDAIDRAEDRERFDALLESLALRRPPGGVARSAASTMKGIVSRNQATKLEDMSEPVTAHEAPSRNGPRLSATQ